MHQVTGQEARAKAKPSPWRDLNVFIAAFAAIASVGSFLFLIPLRLLAKLLFPSRQAELMAYPMSYALIALGLAYVWWRHGLSPRQRDPAKERRFRWGHVLLAVFGLPLLLIHVPFLLGIAHLVPHIPVVALLLNFLNSLAPVGILVGLVMVWSSRATAPAVADTFSPQQVNPNYLRTQPLPPYVHSEPKNLDAAVPKRGAPSTIAVVIGLVTSSLLLYMASVFAALGFQSNASRFTSVVLPIMLVAYTIYVATAWYLLSKRRSTAIWIAWTPVLLVVVGLPAVQATLMAIGSVVGR